MAANAEARLRYYAARFPLVEVDSSYHALPTAENAWRWDQRTPDGFVFNIKAFRLFTGHQTPLSALPADIRAELDGWPAPFSTTTTCPASCATNSGGATRWRWSRCACRAS